MLSPHMHYCTHRYDILNSIVLYTPLYTYWQIMGTIILAFHTCGLPLATSQGFLGVVLTVYHPPCKHHTFLINMHTCQTRWTINAVCWKVLWWYNKTRASLLSSNDHLKFSSVIHPDYVQCFVLLCTECTCSANIYCRCFCYHSVLL